MLHTNLNFDSRRRPEELVRYLNSTEQERRLLVRRDLGLRLKIRQTLGDNPWVPLSADSYLRADELRWNRFKQLATAWLNADRDLGLLEFEVDFDSAIGSSFTKERHFFLSGSPGNYSLTILGLTLHEQQDPEKTACAEATLDFLALISIRESVRFSRCVRCQKFYFARRKSPKMFYCSKRCGTTTTAAKSMQKRRNSERRRKIDSIMEVLATDPSPANTLRRFARLGITKNFLSRGLKTNEIKGALAVKLKRLRIQWDDGTR